MTIRFAHLSDLHYSKDYSLLTGKYAGIMTQMDNPLSQLTSLFSSHQTEKFDFVLLSGDICEHGTVEEYSYIHHQLTDYFQCPILATSGNHENKEAFITGFLNQQLSDPLFTEYHVCGLRVLALDSSSYQYPDGYISMASCQVLRNALADDSPAPILLMTHHHLLAKQFSMPMAKYPEEFSKLVHDPRIVGVFTGHTHHIFEAQFDGKPYYTTGSLSFVGQRNSTSLDFYQHPAALLFTLDAQGLKAEKIESNDCKFLGSIKLEK
jgi:Icc protein